MTRAAVGPAGPVDPGTTLLRAGTRPALAAAVLVAGVSVLWGWRAVGAAVLGGVTLEELRSVVPDVDAPVALLSPEGAG